MILAAGVGSRLDPLTRNVPKPMVPVINRPVMEHIALLLVRHGFDDIFCNTHYLAERIENYFGDGSRVGARMQFNRETELMGTAGGVRRVADEKGFFDNQSTFLVMGGDDLTGIDLTAMLAFHRENKALATIALTKVDDPSQFGVVVLDPAAKGEGGAIERFVEKPKPGAAPSNLVNMGVYLFEPEILEMIPRAEFYDFGKELFPLLLERGARFFGYQTTDYWRDVGNLREYRESQDDFFAGRLEIAVGLPESSDERWIGANCDVDTSATIEAPCVIGDGCKVGANAHIKANSVLGARCVVENDAVVSHSILWDGARVEAGTHLERCIVGYDCHVHSNAAIFDGTIVPPQTDHA